VHSIPSKETSPLEGALVIMNSSSFIGRQALANFFHSMTAQKAHWYNIANSPPSDPSNPKSMQYFQPYQPCSLLVLILWIQC
jgi:hypothetical protein